MKKGCQRAQTRMFSAEEPSRSRLYKCFLTGRYQSPPPTLVPLLPQSSYELTILWHAPHSSRIRPSAALTSVDGAEEKGYEHLPPLDESVAAHLCPPTAIGWKARASHPSKPCRATSALAGRAYSAAGQVDLCSQSAQPFQPLATRAKALQAIPVLSTWVMTTVRRGYTLQFAPAVCSPPQCATRTLRSSAPEVMNLLDKGAIEIVPPAQSESGFYSRYFLYPKKDGGLQSILDLRLLNYTLMKRSFRLITLKQILPQICPGDWFMSLDLKDAYFHIQVAPHHRRFLRFAFEGVAYQRSKSKVLT